MLKITSNGIVFSEVNLQVRSKTKTKIFPRLSAINVSYLDGVFCLNSTATVILRLLFVLLTGSFSDIKNDIYQYMSILNGRAEAFRASVLLPIDFITLINSIGVLPTGK